MPMSTVKPPLTRLSTMPLTGVFSLAACFQLVPDLVAQRLLVADQVAALGLFALDHNLNRIASLELGRAVDDPAPAPAGSALRT